MSVSIKFCFLWLYYISNEIFFNDLAIFNLFEKCRSPDWNLTCFLRLSKRWVTLLCDYLVFYVLSASVWSSKNAWPPPPVGHIADRSNCYLCMRCDPPVSIIVFDHPWVTSQCDKSEPQRYFRYDHRVFWSKQKLSKMIF